jgi:hypothetical protein
MSIEGFLWVWRCRCGRPQLYEPTEALASGPILAKVLIRRPIFLTACSKKAGSSELEELLGHAMSDRRTLNANCSS